MQKIAVITGSHKGLGCAIARIFVEQFLGKGNMAIAAGDGQH
jgi:NAD(P)-dependent dehydrogenase (short-subunit alcohol dehydrogenase family)